MKNNIMKSIKYLYYFSITILLIIYLFPGSIIGILLYGDITYQPVLVKNSLGTALNHFIFFIYITFLALIVNFKNKKHYFLITLFIIITSILLEFLHLIIPNREFEFADLIANIAGIIIVFVFFKIFKKKNV